MADQDKAVYVEIRLVSGKTMIWRDDDADAWVTKVNNVLTVHQLRGYEVKLPPPETPQL